MRLFRVKYDFLAVSLGSIEANVILLQNVRLLQNPLFGYNTCFVLRSTPEGSRECVVPEIMFIGHWRSCQSKSTNHKWRAEDIFQRNRIMRSIHISSNL